MSQSGSLLGNGGGGGGSIQTIDGDIGSITGSTVTIFADNVSNSAGSSVLFDNAGTVSTLKVTDGNGNTFLGSQAGQLINNAANNTGFGASCLGNIDNGAQNVGLGSAMTSLTDGNANVGLGQGSLGSLTTGSGNISIGYTDNPNLSTGSNNITLNGGTNYTGAESNNICINNLGVLGESNKMHLGTSGSGTQQVNQTFVAGITGVTAVGAPTAISSTGQLSDLGFGTATQVLTSNGAGVSPTWQAAGGGVTTTTFRAHLNANTAANLTGDATPVIVPFDTVDYDTASGYNTGTSTYTIPTTGYWSISYTVFSYRVAGANTVETLNILINGATVIRNYEMNFENVQTGGELTLTSAAQNHFTAGDTIQIQCQVGGVAKNIGFAGTFCVFSGFLIH